MAILDAGDSDILADQWAEYGVKGGEVEGDRKTEYVLRDDMHDDPHLMNYGPNW
jgi:hypothetical protein